jgi:anti-sigma regulatory factor (Ser/Thr protein kinase)
MADKRPNVRQAVFDLLGLRDAVSNREVAVATGLSRQSVHAGLAALVASGDLVVEGAGRSTRYRRAALAAVRRPTDGLAEDDVWRELLRAWPALDEAVPDVLGVLQYAVTEMVNNAIDHAESPQVEVRVLRWDESIVVEVVDDGVGALARVRAGLGLDDHFAAVQHLSKGKVTTDPERHRGEGLFFTSKAVDYFVLESDGLRWTVDSRRHDQAVGAGSRTVGTRIRLEVDAAGGRQIAEVFAAYTDPDTLAFSRTRTTLRLFEHGVRFVSRSEAKRLVRGLERFEEVEIDLLGIEEVGQGFVDEVFRVWAHAHPGVRITWSRATEPVAFMIRRGLVVAPAVDTKPGRT